jgi:DNA polymerase
MSRREELLEEMGLTPIWRLRARPGDAREATTSADAAAPTTPDAPAPSSARPAPIERAAPPQPDPASHPAYRAPVARVADGSIAGAIPSAAERRAGILEMDWPALEGCVADCTACGLAAKRNRTVFGVGAKRADWMFVGEGPGAEEDQQGEPFVGQAGKLLDNMLAAIRLKRGESVYIANVVKCRPPGNRNPAPDEAAACEPYLTRQIQLVQPKLIVALGKVAAANLLKTDAAVAAMRGRVHRYQGVPLIVTYHPAYLLRTLPDKAKAWADLCFAVKTMESLTGTTSR